MIRTIGLILMGALTLGAVACGEDEETSAIEVVGTWQSNFGGDEIITETAWGATAIIEFDNGTNFAITQNASDAMFNPSQYNKIVWTEPANDQFYYCFVDFGLDTVEQARTSTQAADASDPGTAGCGGFSWTQLTRS